MISNYPIFTKLDINLKDKITSITSQFAPYSDFNFTSLYCWNVDDSTEVSLLYGNLVIRMPDYLTRRLTYSILGNNRIDESLKILIDAAGQINMVPEIVFESISNKSDFVIVEDRDNFDYIYELHHLAHLPGNKFKKKRNKANVFTRDHASYELEVRTTRELTAHQIKRLTEIDHEWARLTARDEGDILSERKALSLLLQNSSEFDPIVTEIIVDGEIKAFSINEVLHDKFAICHFEKALSTHHVHLNTFLSSVVAKELQKMGCTYVNWEQDLGLEGLRQSKMSYHPINMLKKYTIKLAEPV